MPYNTSFLCKLSEFSITRGVCQVPTPARSYETHTRSRRDIIYTKAHNSRRDIIYTYNNLDQTSGIILASRRDLCYTHTIHTGSRRACTTITISTIHTQTTHHMISTGIQISTRIIHETGKITNHQHTDIMHDYHLLHIARES